MIKISVNPKKYQLSIKGHAEYSESGTDIICASVSFGFYTLAQSMLDYFGMGMLCKEPDMKDNKGNSAIKVIPKKEYESNVQICFATIVRGFEVLSIQYPEFVNLKITEH